MLSSENSIPVPPVLYARPRRRAHIFASALAVVATFASATVSGGQVHVVTPGETLGVIAPAYDTTVSAIVSANQLADPNRIFAGQSLVIPEPTGDSSQGATTYSVVAGDTLAAIAARFGTTVSALADANGIPNPDFVRQGAQLSIPGAASGSQPTTAPSTDGSETHVVATGETLGAIAVRFGVTVNALVEANTIADPNFVREGATLVIPSVAVAPSPAPEPASDQSETTTVVGTQAAPLLDQWSAVYGVPSDLLKALTWFESGWNNNLVSEAGAIGVGQVIPDTVDFVSDILIGEPLDPYNLSDNIQISARFLRYLLDETGWDATRALGAYYQGLASVRRDGIYSSSNFYIDGILALRSRF